MGRGQGKDTTTTTTAAAQGAATAAGGTAPDEGFAGAGTENRREPHSGGPETAAGQGQLTDRESLRITLVRNAHYHEDRERFFARLHRLTMFVVVLSSTASFAFVNTTPWLAGVITIAGLVDLVFDVSGKARLHASLRRRIYDVLAQSEDESRPVVTLREQAVRIYADEPPCMHAVNAIAYNAAMLAFNRPEKYLFVVPWFYRFTRHWISYATVKFKTHEEVEAVAT